MESKVYVLLTSWYNGTVTMGTEASVYTTRELAEKAKDAVKKANETISIYCQIQEVPLHEKEEDVPILNKK